MTRLVPLATVLLAIATPACADDAVLATLSARSGSVPPPYAWSVEVTVRADGRVTVTRCKGYETEGPACKTGEGTAVPGSLPAIRQAAEASGLLARPATAIDPPVVGGGATSGTVRLDGGTVALIADPVAEDEARIGAVLEVIGAAIPDSLLPIIEGE